MRFLVEELTGLREFEAFGFRCFLLELTLAWLCLGISMFGSCGLRQIRAQ